MNLLYYAIPWWVVPTVGVVAVFLGYAGLLALGLRRSTALTICAAVGVAFFVATVFRYGQQSGWETQKQEQVKADRKAVEKADEVDAVVRARPPAETRSELRAWAR